jgi:hypothetical protein
MRRLITVYCLLAGSCDAATGVLLVSAPLWTLGLMGVAPVAEPVFLQWIGVFVGGIGLLYFYPFLLGGEARRRVVLEATALLRLLVAAFVLVSVVRGALAAAWLSVFATDLTLAAVQIVLLWRLKTEEAR